jgi:[protein-PII] uridylyltransferase
MTVVAVGGFGRGLLSPCSDVDLMVLGDRRPDAPSVALITELFHQLWDLGYHLAPSVRSVREVMADARTDPQLFTSLLAARPVTGDGDLFARAAVRLRTVKRRERLRFLTERAHDLRAILDGHGATVMAKEPNLKTDAGGLRSVHLIEWLSSVFYDEAGGGGPSRLLAPPDHRRLMRAYDFLLFVRNLLHFETGRREDVLHIEQHAAVAEVFGIGGSDEERATRLMRRYYARATDILVLLSQSIDHLTLAFLKPRRRRADTEGCFVAASRFHVSPEVVAAADCPPAALRILEECLRRNAAPSSSLIACLTRAARELSRCPAGEPPYSRELFMGFRRILSSSSSSAALAALELSGFLHAYLRPLRPVRHRIVHNSFHKYTVDHHSIEAVRALEAFPARAASDPARYAILAGLTVKYRESLWVAKLALLLHDVGKAYPGDHAKNGAEIVRGYLRALPTESLIKDMIVFLTENHLLLSHVARRGSAEDEQAALHLAGEFILTPFPEESIELLYLLSCADVEATNPHAYSGYVAGLLSSLFLQTTSLIRRGGAEGVDRRAPVAPEELVGELAAPEQREAVVEFAGILGRRYCAANTPEEVIRDYQDLSVLASTAAFRLRVAAHNEYLKVKVMAPDRTGIFSVMCGILLLNGADIVRAGIHTCRGVAIDEFIITAVHGFDFLEKRMEQELTSWVDDLRRSFERYLADPAGLDRLLVEIERRIRAGERAPWP